MKATIGQVRKWMRDNASEYETATELVEGAVATFDLPEFWIDDPDHEVWEIALKAKENDQ